MFVWCLKQTGKVGKLSECMPHELASIFFKLSSLTTVLSDAVEQQWTIFQLDCDLCQELDRIWPLAQSSAWIKRKQSQMWSKRWHWTLFGVYCPSDPLQPSGAIKTITSEKCAQQVNEMHWKLPCMQPALVNSHILPNFHQPLPQAFCTGKCFHSQKDTGNAWGVRQILNHGFLHHKSKSTTTKHTLFLFAKLYGLQWFLFPLMTIWLSLVIMI